MNHEWYRNKLEAIDDKLGQQAETLARLTTSVEHHVKRTDLLEQRVEPINKHVIVVQGIIKSLSVVAILVGILKAFQLI